MLQKVKRSKLKSKEFLRHPEGSIFQDGYGQIPKMIMCDRDLHPYAKLIYAYLCSYAGGGNQAFPGVTRICSDLKISKDTFYKYSKQIEEHGYIVKIQGIDEFGCFTNNIYEFVYKLPEKHRKKHDNVITGDF